jgi:hypothetical protein
VFAKVGEFSSTEEAQPSILKMMDDVAKVREMRQVELELSTTGTVDDETLEKLMDDHLRWLCDEFAKDHGMNRLWVQSQSWSNFSKAWVSWKIAFQNWVGDNHRFPETKGPSRTRHLWETKIFLARLRLARRDDPEFYRFHAFLIFRAARLGDVAFFQEFAKGVRRKVDPRLVQHYMMLAWMPAALWSSSQNAIADLIGSRFEVWGTQRPHNSGEAVRRAWQLLGLWHDPQYCVESFDRDFQPVLRS